MKDMAHLVEPGQNSETKYIPGWIWALRHPNRVNTFWWKLAKENLLCKALLVSRGIILETDK